MFFLHFFQDWDFPHFNGVIDIKPPGIPTTEFSFPIPSCMSYRTNRVEFKGKWLYYGILLVVMMHDMYMWKKQIFYKPFDYGQYTDSQGIFVLWIFVIAGLNQWGTTLQEDLCGAKLTVSN